MGSIFNKRDEFGISLGLKWSLNEEIPEGNPSLTWGAAGRPKIDIFSQPEIATPQPRGV